MGLFSLFTKPRRIESAPLQVAQPRVAAKPAARATVAPAGPQPRRATAHKIDAIEKEMTAEFIGASRLRTIQAPQQAPARSNGNGHGRRPALPHAVPAGGGLGTVMGNTTAFLLSPQTIAETIAQSASEAAPAIDEAAIMFGLGRLGVAEELLQGVIQDDPRAEAARDAWAMLFDLYEVTHRRDLFDALSIAFAEQLETSPPVWHELPQRSATPAAQMNQIPSLLFAGALSGSVARSQAEARRPGPQAQSVRLEFMRVTSIDSEGCEVISELLATLQRSGKSPVLAGAQSLIAAVRPLLQAGRREGGPSPWLLMLDLYRLLDLEQEFEDCCVDYCITFEVSPPSFVPPAQKRTAATAAGSAAGPAEPTIRVAGSVDEHVHRMPAVIDDQCAEQLSAMANFAARHNPAIFDCRDLIRIDFSAAGQLMTCLQPALERGVTVEFRHPNHLVVGLLRVIGLHQLLRIVERR